MNDNNIIKALECQLGIDDSNNCYGCLYREDKSCIDASERILEAVKDLINRQKAEIEKLKKEIEKLESIQEISPEAKHFVDTKADKVISLLNEMIKA